MFDDKIGRLQRLLARGQRTNTFNGTSTTDGEVHARIVATLMAEFINSATFSVAMTSLVTACKSGKVVHTVGPVAGYLPPDPLIFPALAAGLLVPAEHSLLVDGLHNYYMKLGFARSLTRLPAEDWASPDASKSIPWTELCDVWQRVCASALVVVHCSQDSVYVMEAAHQRSLGHLHQLLRSATCGECPCIRSDGRLVVPGWLDQRRHDRKRLDRKVWIETRTGRSHGILQDISTSGFGLSSGPALEVSERVSVQLSDGRILVGIAVWHQDGRSGARLVQPLSETDPLLACEWSSPQTMQ
ncbi:MAG: PilZ domain-containing protein [Hyphomicrobium sp.]